MPEIIVIEIHPSLDRWRKHLVLQFTARWENVVNIDFRVSSALVIHS
jgi:hypothetical protein